MLRMLNLIVLFVILATSANGQASIDREFDELLLATAHHVQRLYIEEVSPDSLLAAGVRGLFNALDAHSNFEVSNHRDDWRGSFSTFREIARAVDSKAYYAVPADTLVRFAIAGMLDVLDPYSVFMESRNLANFNIHTKGHYGGLGFRIQTVYPDSAIAVWSLLHSDTPAARAGVKSGDLILAIDDSTTKHMTVGDAADLMRGKPGTPVMLTLARAGSPDTLTKQIFREIVQVRSIPYRTLFPDSTGYIKLTGFQHNKSNVEMQEAIAGLKEAGMKRLILDLRDNGGGYLQEAVKIADLLLPKDRLVVYTAGRAFPDTTWYVTEADEAIDDSPLVVMVNQGSASASEIVAGAVQDWDRGLVLGTTTVGKGSVQQTYKIGDRAELKLTMAAYYTPSGRSIDKRMRKDSTLVAGREKWEYRTRTLGRIVRGGGGITPDVPIEGRRLTHLFNQLRGWRTLDSKFFHFARMQPSLHPEIGLDYRADDTTLREFREFVEERSFDYVSEPEAYLSGLEKIAVKDEYRKLEKSVHRLKKEIDKVEEQHWQESSELLLYKLTYDTLEKTHGVRAAMAFDVSIDPQVQRAREILANPPAYESFFNTPEIGIALETQELP